MDSNSKEILNQLMYTAFAVPLLLTIVLVWFVVFYQKKKYHTQLQKKEDELRIQKLKIERQEALQLERSRIASEMHDDLGSGLTTIKFLSNRMLRSNSDSQQHAQLTKIVDNSQALISNMSEIIWSMNAGFDTLDNLIAYCRRYSAEYFLTHNIELSYKGLEEKTDIEFSGEKRRNLFLVLKELLHNIVKHSNSQQVFIHWIVDEDSIMLRVKDYNLDQKDRDIEYARIGGNGVRNLKKRIQKLNGQITWKSNQGTQVDISIPLSALNN